MEGGDAMKQFLARHIGTCEDTHNWNHNWLPRDFMLRPLASSKEDTPMSVASFIDNTSVFWNNDMFEEYFLPMDAETIRSIPLCTR